MTVVDTCHCMFVKTQEHTTPRVNLNVNSRVGVIMMVSVDSSIVTNVPLCWGILIVGELCGGGGAAVRAYIGISILSAHFFCEPKTFLKK